MSAAFVNGINSIAARWEAYISESFFSGMIALALAWILSRLFQRRVAAWVVCLLWVLVLVRVALPFKVSVPVPEAAEVMIPGNPAALPDMHEEAAGPVHLSTVSGGAAPVLSTQGILFLVWAAGASAGLAWLVVLTVRTRRIVRNARPLAPGGIPVDAGAIAAGAGLRRPVEIKVSPLVKSPAAAGLWSPVLLLPEGLSGRLTPAQWRWTLAHEFLHLRRGDLWVQVFQSVMKALFFFHPAVWLAGRELDARREELCDAGARTLTGISPQECAEGFLTLLEAAGRGRAVPLAALAMSGNHRRAKHRLQKLLAGAATEARRFTPWAALIIAALLLLPGFRAVKNSKFFSPEKSTGFTQDRTASTGLTAETGDRIRRLESRIADLEKQLQGKSRLDTMRENARTAARLRAAKDEANYAADELHEMEVIYQEARKQTSFDRVAAAMQPLFDRFPGSNRTGCAAVYLANKSQGDERERLLQYAIEHGSDCQFLDGTSVGGLARVLLASDRMAAGRDDAGPLLAEVRASFSEGIDFEGRPLIDLVERLENPR